MTPITQTKKVKPQRFPVAQKRMLWRGGTGVLLLTLMAEWFVSIHAHFGVDGTQGFYAWFGFISCVAIVLVSKVLGLILKRKEHYYK